MYAPAGGEINPLGVKTNLDNLFHAPPIRAEPF